MNPPRLESERLLLQPLNVKDANTLFTYHACPDVARFQAWHLKNESETLQFIKSHEGFDFGMPDTWYQLGINLKSTTELIGDVGIHFLHEKPKVVEIGFTIAPEHQRRGYALEAVSRLLAFLFSEFDVSTVIAVADHQNHPSLELLVRLNFEKTTQASLAFPFEIMPEEVIFSLSRTKWWAEF